MPEIINIAAYKFASLGDLKPLRQRLVSLCREWNLKGTILISTEGINLFVAGESAAIERLLTELRSIPGLETLTPKVSNSSDQPFNRMLVRIKREIIAFGVEGIHPEKKTSRKIDARTLKQWLDEGRPITLLDTRNDYEVKLGTFKKSRVLDIDHFREFPDAVRKLPVELREQPIVMFCTGGIRCEKAGPFMEREGYRDIFQLDGGILKYFEECGGAHYDGECFVFDQRVGIDPALRETESALCYSCLTPLTEEDQKDPRHQPPTSCPYCFKSSDQQMAENIQERQEKIRRSTSPLPGSIPYDNKKPIVIPAEQDGALFLDALCCILKHIPRDEWKSHCEAGQWLNAHDQPVSGSHLVKVGERYYHLQSGIVEPEVRTEIKILHEDDAIIVLNKPAPLPIHPSGRFNRNTLQYILCEAYHPQRPRAAHRLDANTTGLVVCARTRHFAGILQPQFSQGKVDKTYLVKVIGVPPWDHLISEAPVSDAAGETGSREVDDEEGLPAKTEFRLLERRVDGTSLLEAHPFTGRTNQIRVHLWDLGFPVCGDPLYLPGRKLGDTQTLTLNDPPLCLHAWRLSFNHPLTKQRMSFEVAKPW